MQRAGAILADLLVIEFAVDVTRQLEDTQPDDLPVDPIWDLGQRRLDSRVQLFCLFLVANDGSEIDDGPGTR